MRAALIVTGAACGLEIVIPSEAVERGRGLDGWREWDEMQMDAGLIAQSHGVLRRKAKPNAGLVQGSKLAGHPRGRYAHLSLPISSVEYQHQHCGDLPGAT